MKMYGGVEVRILTFSTSTLGGREWSVTCSGHFTPGERAPSTYWVGVWVGPRAALDAVVK